jgi:hypothetical protein
MKVAEISCPSCGATHDVHNPGVITVVCEYCGNAVYWDQEKIQNVGKQSTLPEGFSRLYRGASGTLLNKRFVVMGRVRYSFGQGFWDEWFVEMQDGSIAWLTEDNHEFTLETRVTDVQVPPFDALKAGLRIEARNTPFFIEEVGQAECIGVEGDLPVKMEVGEVYSFADASSPDGRYTLGIEYDEDPPTVFYGHWLKYASITMDDEGEDW